MFAVLTGKRTQKVRFLFLRVPRSPLKATRKKISVFRAPRYCRKVIYRLLWLQSKTFPQS
jgi:hypothetical protein